MSAHGLSHPRLRVLEALTRDPSKRERRSTELLRDPESPGSADWAMYLPTCFNDALDIRRTTRIEDKVPVERWTQGSTFGFRAGDILYDTPEAYQDWAAARPRLRACIQVRDATPVTPAQPGAPRNPGRVEFDLLRPGPNDPQPVPPLSLILTQDEFVRGLITGEWNPNPTPA